MTTDEKYMKQAIKQAKKAYAIDEVPIGCIIVRDEDGKVIARGYNRRNTDKNTLSHAELNAIRKASKKLGDWRLEGCTMYVTLPFISLRVTLSAHAADLPAAHLLRLHRYFHSRPMLSPCVPTVLFICGTGI